MRAAAHRKVRARARGREGFALIVVLMVLIALLVLCAPFLLSARNADRASSELADRIETRVTLDAAERDARLKLAESHPALDRTPYYDTPEELRPDVSFPEGFLDPANAQGQMWKAEIDDISGLLDLNSAPPQLFANLLGLTTRFSRPIKPDDKELPVSSVNGFEPGGMLWSEGELIHYGKLGETDFQNFSRGVASTGEKEWMGGPKPPSVHGAGAAVIDQRAFAVPLWRAAGAEGNFRALDESATLRQCADFVLARATEGAAGKSLWEGDVLTPLFVHGSVYARAREANVWQRAVRLVASVQGGRDGRLRVDSVRWIGPGSTLQIYDGKTRETALVVEVDDQGVVYLDRILQNDYQAYQAEVRVLARRPVNLNSASAEVLRMLFTNLQIKGRNSRINKDEAATLAQVVIESRPLTGWEDFLRRVVLPSCGIEKLPPDAPVIPAALAGGAGFVDELDALALYTNGLNANDGALAFSTLPYCFSSHDVYAFELRATVNAPSGAERFTIVRDEVEVVVPQRRLMQLWSRQEDFDEELRLATEAPWWLTAPSATSSFDSLGSNPPSRLKAHWGTFQGRLFLPGTMTNSAGSAPEDMPKLAQHVFASREDTAWIQLWPSRLEESGRRQGRAIHFDNETRDMEGRYLPDEPINRKPNDKQIKWVSNLQTNSAASVNTMMLPAACSLWVKPRTNADSCLLDVAGGSPGADRLSVVFERGDLVLRVFDATGDHSGTTEIEAGEAHYSFTAGQNAPGMPMDVWSHIAFDVRGTRPDQIALFVNGKQDGVRTFGLTRLTSGIDPSSTQIVVDSVEGFPARGVARIGDELIEYKLGTGNLLDATPEVKGQYAGFGGRLARERTVFVSGSRVPEILFGSGGSTPQAPANVGAHAAGTSVEVFGYSMPLRSNVPNGGSNLPAAMGAWAVGVVSKCVTGTSSQPGEQISVVVPGFGTLPLGKGMDGNPSSVTALELKPAEPQTTQAQVMGAFNPNGGWALIMQVNLGPLTPQALPGQPTPPTINDPRTAPPHNARIGGAEFIWYTAVQGNQLVLDMNRRGNATGFQNQGIGREQRAFVVDWDDNIRFPDPDAQNSAPAQYIDPDTRLEYEVFVMPISVPIPGGTGRFLDPFATPPLQVSTQGANGSTTTQKYVSEYAQITETSAAEMGEWVRYDEIKTDQLIRNEDGALRSAFGALTRRAYDDLTPGTLPVGPNPGGGGGAGGGGTQPTNDVGPKAAVLPSAAAPAQYPSATGSYWREEVGTHETSEGPLTRATACFLQFRGVLGTYSHPHASGTPILPVVRIYRRQGSPTGMLQAEPDAGRPGVADPVFFVEDDPTLLGNPARLQRAYIPYRYQTQRWRQQSANQMIAIDANSPGEKQFITVDNPVDERCVYVAMTQPMPTPYPADVYATGGGSSSGGGNTNTNVVPDIRLRSRMTKHPSGERPRAVTGVRIGGALSGAQGGAVPSALVDEICFGDVLFSKSAPNVAPESAQGAGLWLTQEVKAGATDIYVDPYGVRAPWDMTWATYEFLSELPDDAGLVRVGDEIVCYQSRTTSDGHMELAAGGRGLLGTRPQPHHMHETAQFLEDWVVTVLESGVSADSSSLPIKNVLDFPSEGTVLIDQELIHYTRLEGNALGMPRASSVAGKMDQKGEAFFRGRFGSTRAPHPQGAAVILFPFRYWDRWTERADAPELSHFDLAIDQPSAVWESCFFQKTDVDGAKIGVLQKSDPDAPWDADPDKDQRLALFWEGDAQGSPIEIGKQSDRISWRVFVKYGPDAFDPIASTKHGWRQTPRLNRLGTFYYGPRAVLRSVER